MARTRCTCANKSSSYTTSFWMSRPALGLQICWKGRITTDLRKLGVRDQFKAAPDHEKWRTICHTLVANSSQAAGCAVSARVFKSQSGPTHHKCIAEWQLPIQDQLGAQRCLWCRQWFKSAVGLAVHIRKCQSALPFAICLSPHKHITPNRVPVSNLQCCLFHFSLCTHCFHSAPGFKWYNCHWGLHTMNHDTFDIICNICICRYHHLSDLK